MLQTERVATGITGLDALIEGGLPKGRSILVTGEPGTGKTIFALQFLVEGLKRGEKGIYVTADESPMDVLEQVQEEPAQGERPQVHRHGEEERLPARHQHLDQRP